MSAPGHCRHCGIDTFLPEEGDTGEQLACDEWLHRNNAGAEWDDECCPACAVLLELAERLDAMAGTRAGAVWDGLCWAAREARHMTGKPWKN